MINLLMIATGAGCGAVARHVVTLILSARQRLFPVATLSINLSGCLVIGFLVESGVVGLPGLLLITGFCGGFTTFSTFMTEVVRTWRVNRVVAVQYLVGSVLGGGLLAIIGLQLGAL